MSVGPYAQPIDSTRVYNELANAINANAAAIAAVRSSQAVVGGDATVFANISGGTAALQPVTLTLTLDHDLGSAAGNVPLRGASAWGVATTPWSGANGGTGVANTGKTITIAANLTTTGVGAPTLAFSATGRVYTFPDAAITVAGINLAQTITANQTYSAAQALEPYSYNTPATGNTVTMAAYERRCINDPAGALAALTIVLPPNPVDAQVAGISSTQAVTALTVNAGTGGAAVVGAPAALTAGQAFTMLYRSTGNSWYIAP